MPPITGPQQVVTAPGGEPGPETSASRDERFEVRFTEILAGIPKSPPSGDDARGALERVMSGLVSSSCK